MGAGRDLTFAVAVEAVLLLVLVLVALPGGSTDLLALSAQATRPAVWGEPAHWAAAFAFALVVLAETGRQPVDNPDTHLELTMVHEGPLLEYAGRELAYLQWAAAARHWIMLVLATELFVPHPGPFAARLAVLAGSLPLWCVLLALCRDDAGEDADPARPAVPRRRRRGLPAGAGELVRRGRVVTGALTWALVISALGVVVVRRRSVAIGLVALQSVLLGAHAISDAGGHSTALLVAGAVLLAKAVVLPLGLAARGAAHARGAVDRDASATRSCG